MKTERIRVSIGSAVKLGLKNIALDVAPTNCHLLTYHPSGCEGNCGFCPQSRYTYKKLNQMEDSQEFLSRVMWPDFSFKRVLSVFEDEFSSFSIDETGFQRICLQSLNYDGFKDDVFEITEALSSVTSIPISLAIPPVPLNYLKIYKDAGIDRICFAIDACREDLFTDVKGETHGGPYRWDEHLKLLKQAVEIFDRRRVTTHLIVGLGETECDALKFISFMKGMGVLTGLFAFYPIKNTRFSDRRRPSLSKFRKIQLGKYLIDSGRKSFTDFTFTPEGSVSSFGINGKLLRDIIDLSTPFETSGCPGCNRPFYTSSPREEQYNYPRPLKFNEKEMVFNELIIYCRKDE